MKLTESEATEAEQLYAEFFPDSAEGEMVIGVPDEHRKLRRFVVLLLRRAMPEPQPGFMESYFC